MFDRLAGVRVRNTNRVPFVDEHYRHCRAFVRDYVEENHRYLRHRATHVAENRTRRLLTCRNPLNNHELYRDDRHCEEFRVLSSSFFGRYPYRIDSVDGIASDRDDRERLDDEWSSKDLSQELDSLRMSLKSKKSGRCHWFVNFAERFSERVRVR